MRSTHHHIVRPGMAVRRAAPAPRHLRTRASAIGRAPERAYVPVAETNTAWSISEELKLFGMTFAAGFVFVSVLIG